MALSLAWALAAEAREPRGSGAAEQTTPYVIRQGDTLYDIAARYLRDSGDWRTLARLNHVRAPDHLQPGVTLRLPVSLLREDRVAATVVATSGPADHAYGNGGAYTALAVGMKLTEGDRIRTGHNGFVTLELEDGSHVSVPQDSSIGLDRLRRTVFTGSTDRLIRLERGEVDNEVTHATKKDSRFQIRSPSVVAGVRGTRFRVNYDSDTQVSAVEVLDGAVGVDAAGATPPPGAPLAASAQLVKAKFGSVTRAGGAAGAPLALLAEPSLVQPGKIQDAPEVAFDLTPLDGARSYRVQVGRDAGLLDVICDQRVDTPHASFAEVPDGTYFVRISAIDANGLEGLPHTYAFERRRFSLTTSATPRADSHDYVFRWLTGRPDVPTRYRLVLATTPDLARPLVDQTDVTGAEVIVQNLPRGVYYWTVIAEQFEHGRYYQRASAVQSFTLAR